MLNYASWLANLDNLFFDFCFMAHDDMPDYLWHSLYEDGATPEQAFDEWMNDPSYGYPSL